MPSTRSPRALGVVGPGALLVRPDGQPMSLWTSDADAAGALRGAVAALTGTGSRAEHEAPMPGLAARG